MQGLEKLFDLLKASGWQALFVSLGLFGYLALQANGVIDTDSAPYLIPIVWLIAIALAGVALASFADFVIRKVSEYQKRSAYRAAEATRRTAFIEGIPRLSDRERQIFGYLLEKNLTRFDADSTGGYASNLIAKGYVVPIAKPGMHYSIDRFPYEVPKYVWDEICKNRESFPYTPIKLSRDRGHERPPWVNSPW